MARDEKIPLQLKFDVFPNDTTKRNFHNTVECYNCHGEVDASLWESYNIPSDVNDFKQPFCTPSCFLNALREYRSSEQFLFTQHYLANHLSEWIEPLEIYEENNEDDYQNAKRQKT